MKGNRYCEKIGRAHKSNSIIWNVHLVDRVCWQSCHDPECRGFRGKLVPLPAEVHEEIDEYFLDSELSAFKESEMYKTQQEDASEFNDPELEAAMSQLDISSIAREKAGEEALDMKLANLNLSCTVSKSSEKEGTLLKEEHVDKIACQHPIALQPSCFASNSADTREKEAEEALNAELASLNLSCFVSKSCEKETFISEKENFDKRACQQPVSPQHSCTESKRSEEGRPLPDKGNLRQVLANNQSVGNISTEPTLDIKR